MTIETRTGGKILDFDLESRPLHFWYDGKCTAEITCAAWAWIDHPHDVQVEALTTDPESAYPMLERFVEAYNEADMVVGHNIRDFDLPLLNAAMIELDLPLLKTKLTHDTKNDFVKRRDLGISQEALGQMMLGTNEKHHLTQGDWREANRLTPAGVASTKERAIRDVQQNMHMYAELRSRGLLKAPRLWSSR
ncbi:MAG: hypothetical protein ABIW84_04180 [Ilumatobacteraceae bacterium]